MESPALLFKSKTDDIHRGKLVPVIEESGIEDFGFFAVVDGEFAALP